MQEVSPLPGAPPTQEVTPLQDQWEVDMMSCPREVGDLDGLEVTPVPTADTLAHKAAHVRAQLRREEIQLQEEVAEMEREEQCRERARKRGEVDLTGPAEVPGVTIRAVSKQERAARKRALEARTLATAVRIETARRRRITEVDEAAQVNWTREEETRKQGIRSRKLAIVARYKERQAQAQ